MRICTLGNAPVTAPRMYSGFGRDLGATHRYRRKSKIGVFRMVVLKSTRNLRDEDTPHLIIFVGINISGCKDPCHPTHPA